MLHVRGVANDGAQLLQRGNFFARAGLHEDVAESSGFYWPGDDEPLAGIGCELIEEAVARAAANDVDGFNALTSDRFQLGENCLIFEREALESATNDSSF